MKDATMCVTFLTDQFGRLFVIEEQDFVEGAEVGHCVYSSDLLKKRITRRNAGVAVKQMTFKGSKFNRNIEV